MFFNYIFRSLLARLHLDSLQDKVSPMQIEVALKSFARGSNAYQQAYHEAMKRIQGQKEGFVKLAFRVLSWITCSKRPLVTLELQHALAITDGALALNLRNLTEIGLIVSVCAGLVTVDEKSDIIRFVHYTTQEYFERTWSTWFPNAQTDITKTYVTYLSFATFETGFSLNEKYFEARLQSNVLYDYATRNWAHRARASSIEGGKLIIYLLESEA